MEKCIFFKLKEDLNSKCFSISLYETTATSNVRLDMIARYSDGLRMREKLIKFELVSISTSGHQ